MQSSYVFPLENDSDRYIIADDDLKQAIAWLIFHKGPKITINWPDVTQQEGGSDCGLFCIAIATSLCEGDNPTHLEYNQTGLRSHLLNCFLRRRMSAFPSCLKTMPHVTPLATESFSVHCICRQPLLSNASLTSCHMCKLLFHRECVAVQSNESFICESCVLTNIVN